jgi:hypothetical protein
MKTKLKLPAPGTGNFWLKIYNLIDEGKIKPFDS